MDPKLEVAIKNITHQIISNYTPQSIILFGSAARGTWKEEESDLDFLIVKDNVPRRGIDRILELENLIQRTIACDFLIYQSQELEERKRLGDPLIVSILDEGKILYARS